MDKVLIFDDFLTTNEIKMCMTTLTKPHWGFGHFSTIITDSVNNIPFWTMDLNNCPIFEVYIKKKIEATMNKELSLIKVYANGQTFGQNGMYHYDTETNDEDNIQNYTACIYFSKYDNEESGGGLYFKFKDSNFNFEVEPRKNRLVIFPSTYFHKGCSYNRFSTNLRIVVTWKLKLANKLK